jgi:hypothetical protein
MLRPAADHLQGKVIATIKAEILMKKEISAWAVACCMAASVNAQEVKHINQFIDITGTVGSSQGTVAASYVHNWRLGKARRFEVGIGGRWTTYTGTRKDFITAGPAKYTRSFTVPFVIFFAGQQEENFDTLNVQRPLTHSVNLTANLGYHLNPKWYAGFNIDLIGLTFGRRTTGILTSNGVKKTDSNVNPASGNVLLTGDHDRGSLNSEFFVKYAITERWQLKVVYQFLFVEYKTEQVQQEIPGGPLNDRFRNKANNFGLGIAWHF